MTERSIKAKNLTPLSYKTPVTTSISEGFHLKSASYHHLSLYTLKTTTWSYWTTLRLIQKVIWSWMSCWTASFVDVSATSLCLWSRQSWRTSINQTVTEPRARSWACPVTFVLAPLFSFVWCHLISFFKFNKLWRLCKMNSRQWEYL